jgi:ribosomal protein L37AE/L43A
MGNATQTILRVDFVAFSDTMKVTAVICPNCKDTIFSRAKHDFRKCSCGETAIDGGFDYTKVSFLRNPPNQIYLKVSQTKEDLYRDWNTKADQFGLCTAN